MRYDIFNGDADGIISLLQLRLASPCDSKLITGVKRDIQLVQQVSAQFGDQLTVLDISMAKNMPAVEQALAAGAEIFYADHHLAGDFSPHPQLVTHIDLDPNTCTALIIDVLLQQQYHDWAICAAYGDNLLAKAEQLATIAGYTVEQQAQLKELGTLINYNGYGAKLEDLHYHPADLFQALLNYPSPFDVIADTSSPFYRLQTAYEQDMAQALAITAQHSSQSLGVYELPNNAASRRISGVFGNLLANQNPAAAHAVLTENADGSYTVSLRAPLNNKQGAGDICSSFVSGGGRAAAAGINALDPSLVPAFIKKVESYYANNEV